MEILKEHKIHYGIHFMMIDVAGNTTPPPNKESSTPEEKINETKALNVKINETISI